MSENMKDRFRKRVADLVSSVYIFSLVKFQFKRLEHFFTWNFEFLLSLGSKFWKIGIVKNLSTPLAFFDPCEHHQSERYGLIFT